jgi:hypothetical protein
VGGGLIGGCRGLPRVCVFKMEQMLPLSQFNSFMMSFDNTEKFYVNLIKDPILINRLIGKSS